MTEQLGQQGRIEVSQKFSLSQPKDQTARVIPETDWNRIKRMVKEITPYRNTYQSLASICVGVFLTSLTMRIGFVVTPSVSSNWIIVITCVVVSSFLLGIAFFVFDSKQKQSVTRDVKSVVDEMTQLERNYDTSAAKPDEATK
jgi:hypothetical protein